ncbi:hypothetical protein DL768_009897 [Monosporascus sp. mg162]|nr:hypothetical protein DL768_009897 [Monosporascus sp. mg162]
MTIDHAGVLVPIEKHAEVLTWYLAALTPLGYTKIAAFGEKGEVAGLSDNGQRADWWIVGIPGPKDILPSHTAFLAKGRDAVDSFYKSAIAAGGTDNGAPGVRAQYHANYYAAFVKDPVGNNTALLCDISDKQDTYKERSFTKITKPYFRGIQTGAYDPELPLAGDRLLIPRVHECDDLNRITSEFASDSVKNPVQFGKRNVKLKVRQPGLLETLYFEQVPPRLRLGHGEIEVEVRTVGANFKDCLVALGRVSEDSLGGECAGVVAGVGPECQIQIGDSVFSFARDSFLGRV